MMRRLALWCVFSALPHVCAAQTITPIVHSSVQIEHAGVVI